MERQIRGEGVVIVSAEEFVAQVRRFAAALPTDQTLFVTLAVLGQICVKLLEDAPVSVQAAWLRQVAVDFGFAVVDESGDSDTMH